MTATKHQILSGWGHTPVAECLSYRPEKARDLRAAAKQHDGVLLARGLGRSYGDASLQPEGVVDTTRLDHFLEFDAAQGIVRAQAGVTLADVMDMAVPRGWFPPVIPGTRHITLGGAVACNVHGKNHWRDGEIGEHVLSLRLLLAGGESVECSAAQNSDLFWATVGGMGMTGIIEQVTLKLKPIASASLRATSYRVHSTEEMVESFKHYRDSADYMVGWIDHMATGSEIGRGVFEAASHITTGEGGAKLSNFSPLHSKLSVPFFMPPFLLNRYTMALYNRLRFKKYSAVPTLETVGFNGFFHPLDGIGQWNRLYGKRGFFQYQCLIPETNDSAGRLQEFLSMIHRRRCFSFLAVVKYHRDGKGMLTFSKRGYSVALDFPNTRMVRDLIPELDRWVAGQGGRIYLAKDALLTPELFHAMYDPQAIRWQQLLHDIDPKSAFASLMSQRLQWKGPA